MTDALRCPECGSELPANAPRGLCPRCLMKQALESRSGPMSGLSLPEAGAAPTVIGDFAPDQPEFNVSLFEGLIESRLTVGQQFGEYRIQRLLGKGGMGEVYEAFHGPSGRWVALKVLNQALSSEEDRRRFMREGRLAASVSHPHCVYVFGTEEIDGVPVIVMELATAGTINQLVKRKGPPDVKRTVEMALQIIDGLEAAQAAGVLHRDIKPSNCFLDSLGQVKIGDFGLSIATLAKDQSQLTLTGSFIGTPVFASPEQLRGEKLDIRSDIYSLGITLYYMLTGAVPFEAENMVQLVATVLEKKPVPPNKLRKQIPAALSQVILRCMEKSPEKRFATYDALRVALLPFSPDEPVAAGPARRFVAGAIDNFMLTILVFFPLMGIQLISSGRSLQDFASDSMNAAIFLGLSALQWVYMGICVLYYALTEGFFGATIGKAILQIRVIGEEKRAPGFWRASLRAAILILSPSVIVQTLATLTHTQPSVLQPFSAAGIVISFLYFAVFLLLFSTMRERNGFAAIHDLVTKTRVVSKPARVSDAVTIRTETIDAEPNILSTIGPYGILTALSEGSDENVLRAYDPVLRRYVWLHVLPSGAPPLSPERRDISRQGRLRWINGLRSSESSWDAFEAPDGSSFGDIVSKGPQPWSAVRRWMSDIADEIAASAKDDSLPEPLRMDHVWITPQGRAKLLDFAPEGTLAPMNENLGVPYNPRDLREVQKFLFDFARIALDGAANSAGTQILSLRPPRGPAHAIAIVDTLAQGAYHDAASIALAIRKCIALPDTVTWKRRLACMSALLALPILWTVLTTGGAAMYFFANLQTIRNRPELYRLAAAVEELRLSARENENPTAEAIAMRKALEIYIAGNFRDAVNDPMVRTNVFLGLAETNTQKLVGQALTSNPSPAAGQVAAANETVGPAIDQWLAKNKPTGGMDVFKVSPFFLMATSFSLLLLLGFASPFFLVFAAATRGGVLLRVGGLVVVTKNGTRVSHLRALWRSIIAWSPCWAYVLVFFFVQHATIYGNSSFIGAFAAVGILIAGATFTIFARRSVQDFFAGTYIVAQ
jgi:serine/threonine protein kinase